MRATRPLFARLRRLALTTKQTNKGYYKGTGSGSMGRHTKHGDYKLEYHKVRTYRVPANLQDFKLTPFVTKNMEPLKGNFDGDPKGGFSAQRYLDKWKRENGQD